MTIRLYQPTKKIYLWITSKIKNMYNSRNLKSLQSARLKVLTAIKEFIETYEDKEYLTLSALNEESIDVIIGEQKFTIQAEVSVDERCVFFKVYHWIFDPKSTSRYSMVNADECNFVRDSNYKLKFLKPQILDRTEFTKLCQLNELNYEVFVEPLLNVFEKYAEKKQEPWIEMIRNSVEIR